MLYCQYLIKPGSNYEVQHICLLGSNVRNYTVLLKLHGGNVFHQLYKRGGRGSGEVS